MNYSSMSASRFSNLRRPLITIQRLIFSGVGAVLFLLSPLTTITYAADYAAADRSEPMRRLESPTQQTEQTYSLTDVPILYSQSGLGPIEINTSVGQDLPNDGNTMQINGVTYDKGFGTHAISVIAFDIEGKCSTFTSDVGIDDEVNENGSAVFMVFGNQEKLYDSGVMNGTDPAKSTGAIDIQDVDELLLIVTDADDFHHDDHANWAAPEITCTSQPDGDGASFRHLRGYWEPVMSWPVKAIHASLLPSGHILSHASAEPGSIGSNDPTDPHNMTKVDLADIAEWNHEWVDHESEEMYCSAHTLLSDGSVFEIGGHGGATEQFFYYGQEQASVFDFATKSWTVKASMSQPRWYPSAVTLGNGQVMAIGGSHAGGNTFKPEIWTGNSWRTLEDASYATRLFNGNVIFDHTYPFVHLVSDGRVFWAGWDQFMAYLNPTGGGHWSQNYKREDIQRQWGSPVMYQQDEILLIGGINPGTEFELATKSTAKIDLTNEVPVVSFTDPMLFPRADVDGTILANGEVLVNGGGYDHILGYSPNHIFVPEIWNPESGKWSLGTAAANPRGYHSSTLLLPDGRVWTGGGECGEECTKGKTAQIYNPPYLFKQDGSGGYATRPVINSAPELISYGSSFDLDISSANGLDKLTFIRLGSTTHHINFEQRYMELPFILQEDGTATAVAPANGNLAPPGHYMLFAIDEDGVPSASKMVQILPMTLAPASCNLLKNADFELGLLQWQERGGASPTADAESGTGAVVINSDFIGQPVDARAGERYVFSGHYKTGATFFQITVGMDFLNESDVKIGDSQIALLDAPEYTQFSLSGEAPLGTTQILVWLYSDSSSELLVDTLDFHADGCIENVAPQLASIADQSSVVGDEVSLALSATDEDAAALSFGATNLPPGVAITTTDVMSAVISGVVDTVGEYSVTVTISDTRGGVDSDTFVWTVSDVLNNPPILSAVLTRTNKVGDEISFGLLAVDNDDGPITYVAQGLPPGLNLSSETGVISGMLTTSGTFAVIVTANDDSDASDSVEFSWVVEDKSNSGPSVPTMSDQTVTISKTASITITATDPDGDALSYSSSDLPPGLSIDSDTGVISGMPTKSGTYPVTVIVTDSSNAAETLNFTIQVNESEDPDGTENPNAVFLPYL